MNLGVIVKKSKSINTKKIKRVLFSLNEVSTYAFSICSGALVGYLAGGATWLCVGSLVGVAMGFIVWQFNQSLKIKKQ